MAQRLVLIGGDCLPYMYSRLISRREKKAGDINGCIRVYPMPAIPAEPRYL